MLKYCYNTVKALVLVIYLSSNLYSKHFSNAFVTLYILFTGKVLLVNLLVYFFCKGIYRFKTLFI